MADTADGVMQSIVRRDKKNLRDQNSEKYMMISIVQSLLNCTQSIAGNFDHCNRLIATIFMQKYVNSADLIEKHVQEKTKKLSNTISSFFIIHKGEYGLKIYRTKAGK